jgi:hypothetical protein
MGVFFSKIQFAFEHRDRRSRHHHVGAFPGPGDVQIAAPRQHSHRGIEQAARNAHHDGGAGPGPACQRFPRPALVDAQFHPAPVKNLDVSRVHPFGKAGMPLDQRTFGRYRRRVHVGDELHRVRVAHRDRTDLHLPAFDIQLVGRGARVGNEGNPGRLEFRHPHVDRDAAIRLQPGFDHPGAGFHPDGALCAQSFVVNVTHETAGAVAALAHLAAVGVENPVIEIGAGGARRLDHEHLVEADAEMAVGQPANGVAVERREWTASITTKSLPRRASW